MWSPERCDFYWKNLDFIENPKVVLTVDYLSFTNSVTLLYVTFLTNWQSGSYLSSQCVDNSSVAQHHRRRWQQVCGKNERRSEGFLGNIAGECTPRYTRSLDDVRAHCTDNCHHCRYHDPNSHDCRIHQARLSLQLQIDRSASRQSAAQRDLLWLSQLEKNVSEIKLELNCVSVKYVSKCRYL